MLSIFGNKIVNHCDNLSRRSFVRVGTLGLGAGLSLPEVLRANTQQIDETKSIIMVYLCGGPTQHETFDPKPNAPQEIRGSYNPISTKIPGIQFCELLPKLSSMSDRFSIVRTLTGMENRHESFQCYTGRPGGRPQDSEPAGGWPTFGSVASKVLGSGGGGAGAPAARAARGGPGAARARPWAQRDARVVSCQGDGAARAALVAAHSGQGVLYNTPYL